MSDTLIYLNNYDTYSRYYFFTVNIYKYDVKYRADACIYWQVRNKYSFSKQIKAFTKKYDTMTEIVSSGIFKSHKLFICIIVAIPFRRIDYHC